ncbi:MAG: hypothetical protein IJ557_07745 [Bacteroidaceae bacterium]|nr:hypothetical protein [Bacteroidaceae bacterium]
MRENTNTAIVANSVIMYARLAIISIAGLLTTRFALQALGVTDFGLFSVVGSVISFIGFFNTVMISVSNRFMAVAIGKGDKDEINKAFNVNFTIHLVIAIVTLLIAYPLGDWYILHFVNFDGDINLAVKVYNVTVIGSIIAFIGVPYNGLLIARERFFVFCLTDVLTHVFKVVFTYLLITHFDDKLTVYSFIVAITTGTPTLIYALYCHKAFPDTCRFKRVHDKAYYKSVFSFSGWVAYGAVAYVGKSQGASLIVNAFFNTILNTALGIAQNVNSILLMFANNIGKTITPQITKAYAEGNIDRSKKLVVTSSKLTFLVMLLVSSPFIVAPEFVFKLWLGSVPEYVITFTYLIIADALINTLNIGAIDIVFASGKIKKFQFITNTLLLSSILAAYIVLKLGAEPYSLLVVYIIFSILMVIVRQILLHQMVGVELHDFIRGVYRPAVFIVFLFAPIIMLKGIIGPLWLIVLSLIYLCVIIYFIGISQSERQIVFGIFGRVIEKFKKK